MPHSYLRSIQVIRALKILVLLEPSQYGMSIERLRAELVESLGLSSLNAKTVKRDIEALQAVGFNISDDEQPGAFKLRRPHTKVPELPISAIELLALATARKLALPLIGTFAPYVGLEMLWHRLQEALPDAPWLQVEEETERQQVSPDERLGRYLDKEGLISTLHRSMRERKMLKLEYKGSRDTDYRARLVEPYTLVLQSCSMYLVAVDSEDTGSPTLLKWFKVDRIRKATTDQARHFSKREDVDLDEFLRQSHRGFGPGRNTTSLEDIELVVEPPLVEWVKEEEIPPRQIVEASGDGCVRVRIDQALLESLLPRILSLGEHVRVVRPELLCQRVRETAAKVAGFYDNTQ